MTPARTPLYSRHVALGAKMVEFGGWEMPVQYTGIIREHLACRAAAVIFDVSHMGEVAFRGPGALAAIQRISTNDAAKLVDGRVQYAAMCTETGGVVDDITVYRRGPEEYFFVVNASNRAKDVAWIRKHVAGDARVEDLSDATALLAVQGPKAPGIVRRVADREVLDLPRYWFRDGVIETAEGRVPATFSRTGYTGEDGLELVVPAELGPRLWCTLLAAGVQPCGLGARDTLRLEAALLLYGNDLDTTVNPFEAGLGWVVSLDDGADFIGRQALLRVKETGSQRLLACLKAEERGVMRPGCPVLLSGRPVGKVTSGGFSPTLGVSIGMAFLPSELAGPGTELTVDVRGKPLPVRVVPRPFYKPGRPA